MELGLTGAIAFESRQVLPSVFRSVQSEQPTVLEMEKIGFSEINKGRQPLELGRRKLVSQKSIKASSGKKRGQKKVVAEV